MDKTIEHNKQALQAEGAVAQTEGAVVRAQGAAVRAESAVAQVEGAVAPTQTEGASVYAPMPHGRAMLRTSTARTPSITFVVNGFL